MKFLQEIKMNQIIKQNKWLDWLTKLNSYSANIALFSAGMYVLEISHISMLKGTVTLFLLGIILFACATLLHLKNYDKWYK